MPDNKSSKSLFDIIEGTPTAKPGAPSEPVTQKHTAAVKQESKQVAQKKTPTKSLYDVLEHRPEPTVEPGPWGAFADIPRQIAASSKEQLLEKAPSYQPSPMELLTGPGTKEFLEFVPGGKFLYPKEREKFMDLPTTALGVPPETPVPEDRVPETKLKRILEELHKAAGWYTFGKGIEFGGILMSAVPRLEKILKYPLETLVRKKSTVTKTLDDIITKASKEKLPPEGEKILDLVKQTKDAVVNAPSKLTTKIGTREPPSFLRRPVTSRAKPEITTKHAKAPDASAAKRDFARKVAKVKQSEVARAKVKVVPGTKFTELEMKKIVEDAGGKFGGVIEREEILKKRGWEDYVNVHEPIDRSTLEIPLSKFSKKGVEEKLAEYAGKVERLKTAKTSPKTLQPPGKTLVTPTKKDTIITESGPRKEISYDRGIRDWEKQGGKIERGEHIKSRPYAEKPELWMDKKAAGRMTKDIKETTGVDFTVSKTPATKGPSLLSDVIESYRKMQITHGRKTAEQWLKKHWEKQGGAEQALEDSGEYMGSMFGGAEKWFMKRAAKREGVEPTASEMRLRTRWWGVRKPWEDMKKPETGRKISNIYSMMETVEEYGNSVMKDISKLGKTGLRVLKKPLAKESERFTHSDLSDIVLNAELSKGEFAKLPQQTQDKLGGAVKRLQKFFTDSQKAYRKRGANPDFKNNMIVQFEDDILRMEKTQKDILDGSITRFTKNDLAKLGIRLPKEAKYNPKNVKQVHEILSKTIKENKEIIDRLGKLEYVHIPYGMWFEQGLVNRGAATKALRLANLKKRKTIAIADLVESGAIEKNKINVFDVIASYSRKMAKDFAMLDIKNAGRAEGLLVRMKGLKKADIPPGFSRIDGRVAPLFADSYIHPAFKDWIYNWNAQTSHQNWIGKSFSMTKMWQFAKPLFLPYYDTFQHIALRSYGMLNPYGVGRDIYHAIRLMKTKPKEYYDILGEGLASKPFDLPWKTTKNLIEAYSETTLGEMFLGMAKRNKSIVKPVYEALWETAWMGDIFIRLMSNSYLTRGKKMSLSGAADLASFFHSAYADVPKTTTKHLNKILFTGTFKITMAKLYASMAKNMAKVPYKTMTGRHADLTAQEKLIARGGLTTVAGVMGGMDVVMTKMLGYERDQFARRYYKSVDTDEGPKESVVVFANPLTMIPKYVIKLNRLARTMYYGDNKMIGAVNAFKWDIHPIYRIAYNLGRNIDDKNDYIYTPGDSPGVSTAKRLKYISKEIWRVFEYIDDKEDQQEAWKHFQKDIGFVLSSIMKPATFTYLRDPSSKRKRTQLYMMQQDVRKVMYKLKRDNKYTPEVAKRLMDEFKKKASVLHREIEKADKEHDERVHKKDLEQFKKEQSANKLPATKLLKPPN